MRKTFIIALVLVALPLYSYNAFLLLRSVFPGREDRTAAVKSGKSSLSMERLLAAAAPVRFEPGGRDPFTLYAEKPKPTPAKIPVIVNKPKTDKKEIAPPPIVITGIMWHPDNPVATIKLPTGASSLVRAGQRIGDDLIVKRIERKSVTVEFGGKEFTVERR